MHTSFDQECYFNNPIFCEFWDKVESILPSFYGVPDDGWMLDEIIKTFINGESPNVAVDNIENGYDPTPQTPYDFFH